MYTKPVCSVVIMLLCLANSASGVITISSTEIWDGGQMHGITPSGSGTASDPYVYVIPDGMTLTGAGVIRMNAKYVTFDFSSGTGGLGMAAGGYFDLTGSARLSDPGQCTIILGNHNLTGAGDFKTVDISKDSMDVSITGSGSVTVDSFYMRTIDAFPGSLEIDIGGSASVDSVDTQDQAVGGNNGGDVIIRAADVTAGDIDTRSLRTASSDRFSGGVLLEAHDPGGTNTLYNSVNLYGTINTDAAAGNDGAVLIRGVVVTLESGFSAVTGSGSLEVYAGMVQYGKPADELFVDDSGGGYAAIHNVPWTYPSSVFNASNPSPHYYALSVDPNVVLSWSPGICAVGHDVYLGTDFNDVNNATDPNILPGRGRQEPNSYAPDSLLELGSSYFWRIDEVNNLDSNSPWKGSVWKFTVDDGRARNVEPYDGASFVPPSAELVWTPGVLANTHDVYLGTDFDEVNDANSTLAVDVSVYKGRQGANDYDPVALALDTTYYWRIDEVGSSTFVKGDVWSFRTTSVNIINNVLVYYEAGRFAGWPANNGLLWHWGDDEVVVGFSQADFCCKGGHNNCGESYNVLARSTDSGMTWTVFDPPDYVGDGGSPGPFPGVNFADPNFAMRVDEEEYYVSYDRCQSWEGPYDMGTFGESTVDSWENTSRTDYIVNGPDDCLVFMSVKPVGGAFGTDRAFCIRTTDGGVTFQFQGWIVPPVDPYRGVMPSTVRCSPTKLVSALRRRNMSESCDAWVDVYVSNDNGVNWSFLSGVGETGCENGNPPALARLSDGRLSCVYGNRSDMRMYMKYSDDEGASWGPQIALRDDWADCADDRQDLGYPRITQMAHGRIICAYYWSTPDKIENHIAATIWDPGGGIEFGTAWDPSPPDGANDVPPDVILIWKPGDFAASHDVYFGTHFNDVNDANRTNHPNVDYNNVAVTTYDPGLLEFGQIYYWRVDEVNGLNTWAGDVWSFTTANYILIDDMESYNNTDNLISQTWSGGSTGALLGLGIGPNEPVHSGEQSMKYTYWNGFDFGAGYYSEIERQYPDPCNWTTFGVKALTLYFYGDPNNDAGEFEQMYVVLEDSNGAYAESRYPLEDMSDITLADWHQWNIALVDFTDVNLAAVNKLCIGFGYRGNWMPGGFGVVYFDDMRLYPPRCILSFRSEELAAVDLSNNCIVDFADVQAMSTQWLQSGQNTADVYEDSIVNLKDFAVLANSWLEKELWPEL